MYDGFRPFQVIATQDDIDEVRRDLVEVKEAIASLKKRVSDVEHGR